MTDQSLRPRFRDYQDDAHEWITVIERPFFPDSLDTAAVLYGPILDRFSELVDEASSSVGLFRSIQEEPSELRVKLLRVFRRYVSPVTPVEMLKRKNKADETISQFGDRFRDLEAVRIKLAGRPDPDETIMGLLDEYTDRGAAGYTTTEAFFTWFEAEFADDGWTIEGPVRAGRDVDLQRVLPDYPNPIAVDLVIRDPEGSIRVVGFGRYDSDRGGAQEDDRVGGNLQHLQEILSYADSTDRDLKVLFLNDGPGLLLGSMWRDYSEIEEYDPGRCMVATLKMVQAGRFSRAWISS